MNHKAIEPLTLVTWILLAISILIATNILLGYQHRVDPLLSKETCRASVESMSNLRLGSLKRLETGLKCPTEDLTITESLASERGQQTAKQRIADSMYHCWDKFERGDAVLFDEQGVYCSVCNWVSFTDKGKELSGISTYLATTSIPGKQLTYMDFLAKKETPTFKSVYAQYPETNVADTMDTDELYSIVFVYARGDQSMRQLAESYVSPVPVTGVTVGSAGATLFAASVFKSHPLIQLGSSAILAGSLGLAVQHQMERTPSWLATIALVPHNEAELKKLGCTTFTSTA